MTLQNPASRTAITPFALIALLQALAFAWLRAATDAAQWPATSDTAFQALLLAAVFAPWTAYRLLPGGTPRAAAPALLATLGYLLLAGAHQGANVMLHTAGERTHGGPDAALYLGTAVLLQVALAWWLAAREAGRPWPEPAALLRHGLENLMLAGLSLAVVGLIWLLLRVTASLFRMIGLEVLEVLLFRIERIELAVLALSIGAAVYVVASTPKLVATVLAQALSLLRRLLPFAAVLLYAFVIALALRTPSILATHERVIAAQWLLCMDLIMLLLLNAHWRQAAAGPPPAPAIARLVGLVPAALVLLAALACYAIGVRIDAYGLTVQRVWALYVALVCLATTAGYLVLGLAGPGERAIGLVNRGLALGLIVTLALMALPPLSPERLAALGMRAHLLGHPASAERGSLASLYFDDGRYGREVYAALVALPPGGERAPLQAVVAEFRADLERGGDRWTIESAPARGAGRERVYALYPAGRSLEPSLEAAIRRAYPGVAPLCTAAEPCPLVFTNLSAGAAPEAVLLFGPGGRVFRRGAEGWTAVAALQLGRCRPCSVRALREALSRGELRVRPAEWSVLEVGPATFRVNDAR